MYESLFKMLEVSFLETITEAVSSTNITFAETGLMIIISFICGFMISITYMNTSENGKYSKNFGLTMVLLPVVISSIILLIGSDIARAFSLAGAFAIIRFRSEPGEPKDIAYVLFSMASGLALGIGEYWFAIAFSLILCTFMILLSKTNFGNNKLAYKHLKVTIPEDLNYEEEFKEVFNKYEITYTLKKVSTTSLGSLYQIYYDVVFKENMSIQAFMDDLRIRNSNLDISLSIDKK